MHEGIVLPSAKGPEAKSTAQDSNQTRFISVCIVPRPPRHRRVHVEVPPGRPRQPAAHARRLQCLSCNLTHLIGHEA